MTLVQGETVLFAAGDHAALAFPAAEVVRVYNSTTGEEFRPGTDLGWTPGSCEVTRPAGSAAGTSSPGTSLKSITGRRRRSRSRLRFLPGNSPVSGGTACAESP